VDIIFKKRNRFLKVLEISILMLFIWILLNAGGRGPFIALIIIILLPIFCGIRINSALKIKFKKYFIKLFMLLLVLIFIFLFLSYDNNYKTIKRISTIFTKENLGSSISIRLKYYKDSISLWMRNPIFGNGIGSWPILMNLGDQRNYPHNILFEIAVELGIIGLIFFMFLVFFSLKTFIKNYNGFNKNILKIISILLFIFLFLRTMVSGEINDHRAFFAIMGLLVYSTKGVENGENCSDNVIAQ